MKYSFTIRDMEEEQCAYNKPVADNQGLTLFPSGHDPELPVISISHPHHGFH
jgi:hypothetical protein